MQISPTRASRLLRWWPRCVTPALLGSLVLSLLAAAANSAASQQSTAPDPAKLTQLVLQDCGSCHGMTLKGGLGKPLTAEHLAQWNREQIVHIILEGVPGTPMPPWKPLLSEAEARWIADRLKQGTLP